MKLPLARIAELLQADAAPATLLRGDATGYSIDSRTIQAGELFFAVKGEHLDGHDYVLAALEKGATAAVIDKKREARFPGQPVIVVEDTLHALQTLGFAVRRIWNHPLIAVTGSAGKTTTKEAIAHVLSARFRVFKSAGNLNNHFGLPLQLLKLEPEYEVAVIEMGMSALGEIAALARIAQPDIGVVTNVAPVHLEFFNSIADIAHAKYELIQGLHTGGVAILNADDECVSQFGRDFHGKVVYYGIHKPADVSAHDVQNRGSEGSRFVLVTDGVQQPVSLPLLGEHNIYNALAGAAVALDRGMAPSEIAAALATLSPAEKRGQTLTISGATVINDCYNSNPKALNAMVDTLASLPAARRIVVAGEMLELGATAAELHHACGRHMAEKGVTTVIGVRGLAEHIVAGAREIGADAQFVETPQQAGAWLAANARAGDAVLLKASRGVRLEGALETWQQV